MGRSKKETELPFELICIHIGKNEALTNVGHLAIRHKISDEIRKHGIKVCGGGMTIGFGEHATMDIDVEVNNKPNLTKLKVLQAKLHGIVKTQLAPTKLANSDISISLPSRDQ